MCSTLKIWAVHFDSYKNVSSFNQSVITNKQDQQSDAFRQARTVPGCESYN